MYDRLLAPAGPERRLSASTVVRIHSTLMVALNAAVRSGRLERNPAALAELPAPRRLERHVWNADELMTFLDSIVDDAMHALFTLLAVRGLRRGEAFRPKWSDADLPGLQIRITQQLSLDRGTATFGLPKLRAGDRLIAIDEWTDLPRIRLHDLRHTSASIGLASGESLFEVSQRLRHSSVASTGEIYAHVSSESA